MRKLARLTAYNLQRRYSRAKIGEDIKVIAGTYHHTWSLSEAIKQKSLADLHCERIYHARATLKGEVEAVN